MRTWNEPLTPCQRIQDDVSSSSERKAQYFADPAMSESQGYELRIRSLPFVPSWLEHRSLYASVNMRRISPIYWYPLTRLPLQVMFVPESQRSMNGACWHQNKQMILVSPELSRSPGSECKCGENGGPSRSGTL